MSPPLVVSDACRRLGLNSRAAVLRNVRVGETGAAQREELADIVSQVRQGLHGPADIRALPEVSAFRDILRNAGVDPRKHPPTVEGLLKRAVKHGALPSVNCLVDAYNGASVRTRCSMGAHDVDSLSLPVELRTLTGAETFAPLGSDSPAPVDVGAFGYVDQRQRVICWCDVQQAEFSKVTTATRNVLVIVEGTAMHTEDALRSALDEAIAAIVRYCGGTVEAT